MAAIALVVLLIGHGVTLTAAVLAFFSSKKNSSKIQEVHLSINSRMDQMLKMAYDKGVLEAAEKLKQEQEASKK